MTYGTRKRGSKFIPIVEAFRGHVRKRPDDPIFHYLQDHDDAAISLSFRELDRASRAIANALRGQVAPGERALMLFPPDLDFIKAFAGCLYAGVVAVPTYPPNPARLNRTLPRFLAIANAANPKIVLTTSEIMAMSEALTAFAPAFKEIRWLAIDELDGSEEDDYVEVPVEPDDAALIQYTSGSTGEPSGVIITHRNVIHNQEILGQSLAHSMTRVGVNWLPLYHDMGLGNVMQPMHLGCPMVTMSPISFLKRPLRWLEAISRYRATTTGGPNFAYEMCVRKVSDEQLKQLDLSCWELAYNGAEQIRAESMRRFTEKFSRCGFRAEVFYPCYGLAEGTLMVTGGKKLAGYRVLHVDPTALEREHVAIRADEAHGRSLVSSGRPWLGLEVKIVDARSCTELPAMNVGEIWTRGDSIARGYWAQEEKTEKFFGAHIAGSGEGPFLRTGDLGFLDEDGELYVTGRIKDLIIIHGRNHYPHDVELTAEASNPAALRPGCSAAFSVEVEGSERLVIVQELERRTQRDRQSAPDRRAPHPEIDATVPKLNAPLDTTQIVEGIRHAVSEAHDIGVYSLVLVKPGTINKTSSGKIQRSACREAYLEGTLEIVSEWREPKAATSEVQEAEQPVAHAQQRAVKRSTRDIEDWLRSQLARRLNLDPRNVERRRPFWSYGLDSKETLNLLGELESWLDRRLPDTLLWDYPSIGSLARHLAGASPVTKQVTERTPRAHAADEPVAIIGVACRFPGARDPEELWRLLRAGGDAVSELPEERRRIAPAWTALGEGDAATAIRRGGFLDQIDAFDPGFFDISQREAARMDPQQRLLLEVAWELFEDVGLTIDQLAGSSTGVFVGVSGFDYARLARSSAVEIDIHDGTGNALSVAANRISYQFDLQGPSLAVDTACSSSLYAVHLACQSLLSGESGVALAGGVNVILTPDVTINFNKAGVLSPDGRCKAFDGRADGYVRSEGAGAVLLKPLSDALSDGDHVYAVIRGSAANNDGLSNGLVAPNGLAQERVLRAAYGRAHVEPGKVQYVEAYGTGTIVGDPIEARALGNVMREDRPPDRPCAIGSIKTNLGHLEAASGIAGLIKVALSLDRGELPPSIHFQRPNPHIPFAELGLEVQRALGPWRDDPSPPLAGVSSFGFGGTNVHVVMEGAPAAVGAEEVASPDDTSQLLPISARSYPALMELMERYRSMLTSGAEAGALHDLCRTAALHRAHHDHRIAIAGSDHAALADTLQRALDQEQRSPHTVVPRPPAQQPQVAYVFSGLGSECQPLGDNLLKDEPAFRQTIETCDRILLRHVPWSLMEELERDAASSRLVQTDIAQPALFAVQISLVALWRSWGIAPSVVVGHGAGEVAAAYVAGALSLDDAIRVIAQRGRVMRLREGLGRVIEVELDGDQVLDLLTRYEDRLTLAAHNGPKTSVLSGEPEVIQEVIDELEAHGTGVRLLRSTIAQQSSQMEGPREAMVQALEGLRPQRPTLPLWSTVTGGPGDEVMFDAEHWGRSLRETVQFAPVIARLVKAGCELFIEVGPDPTLTDAVQQELHAHQQTGAVLASLRRDTDARSALLATLGELYSCGLDVEWAALYPGKGRRVRVPSYPWHRQRCWFDQLPDNAQDSTASSSSSEPDHTHTPKHGGGEWVTSPRWNSRAKLRLFCLPYGGRGASLFSAWVDLLPPEVELCPVQLPGRENRISEPSITNMQELVEALAVQLMPFLDRPYALFGHCIGSQIGFELARQLYASGAPAPGQLFVSALNPPGHEKIAIVPEGCIHELPAEAFARAVRDNPETPAVLLEDERLFNLVLPSLRADFALYETHQPKPGEPLACPITVFGANDDVTVSDQHLEAWRSRTSGRFRRHMYPGDHFYLQQPRERDAMLKQLGRELLELIGMAGD